MLTHNRTQQSNVAPTLTRDAAITKQELAVASAQYGAGNSKKFEGYEANTLRLVTFTGVWDGGQRKFIGFYAFTSGGSWLAGEVDLMTDFNKLPGIALQRVSKPAPRVAEAVESDHVADL